MDNVDKSIYPPGSYAIDCKGCVGSICDHEIFDVLFVDPCSYTPLTLSTSFPALTEHKLLYPMKTVFPDGIN